MKISSIVTKEDAANAGGIESWLSTLVTTVELPFPARAISVTSGVPSKKLLRWLEVDAVGQIAIRQVADARAVIAFSSREDMFSVRNKFNHQIDVIILCHDQKEYNFDV